MSSSNSRLRKPRRSKLGERVRDVWYWSRPSPPTPLVRAAIRQGEHKAAKQRAKRARLRKRQ